MFPGVADTPSWLGNIIGIPAGVAGIGIPLYLWLSGKVRLSSDVQSELDVVKKSLEDQLTQAKTGLEEKLKQRDDEIIALRADRDAWRIAQAAEVEARQAASRAAASLLDSASLSNSLLDALKDVLGQQIPKKPRS